VTAGHGIERILPLQGRHDDYSDILLKALADRSPRPSPSGCTTMSAPRSGAMPRASSSPTRR
jgi:hypothetical protein